MGDKSFTVMACFFANQWRGELVFALCTCLLRRLLVNLCTIFLLLNIFRYTDCNENFQMILRLVLMIKRNISFSQCIRSLLNDLFVSPRIEQFNKSKGIAFVNHLQPSIETKRSKNLTGQFHCEKI